MKHSVKYYLYKARWPFVIILFVVFAGFVGENCWINRIQQKKEMMKLKSEIDEYDRKFQADKVELNRMKYVPEASAEVAREKYMMKKADEDIYVFEDEE